MYTYINTIDLSVFLYSIIVNLLCGWVPTSRFFWHILSMRFYVKKCILNVLSELLITLLCNMFVPKNKNKMYAYHLLFWSMTFIHIFFFFNSGPLRYIFLTPSTTYISIFFFFENSDVLISNIESIIW